MAQLIGQEAINMVRNALKLSLEKKGFNNFMDKVAITSAGQGNCLAEFTVTEEMTNAGGTLHGGCTATIIDVISTLGLLTHKNPTPGVSVNLSVNYMRAAKPGEEVIVESKAVKVGKTLVYLDIQLRNKKTGAVIASGSHVKYVGGADMLGMYNETYVTMKGQLVPGQQNSN